MRTGEVTIQGKKYLTCLSTRVMVALEERGGSAEKELNRILKNEKMGDLFWLLAQMLQAGDRYAKAEGLDNPGPLSEDFLLDCLGPDDYPSLFAAVTAAVEKGATPTVEAAPGKNEGAAQGAG